MPIASNTSYRNTARACLLLAISASWACWAAGDEPRSAPVPEPQPRLLPDPYRVLLLRSIFSKDRSRPEGSKASTTQDSRAEISQAESNFVLKGVATVDDVTTAFFEQTSDKQLVRLRSGDRVSHGQLTAITLDGVDYAVDGKASHINIGQTLDGGVPVTAQAASGSSGNNAGSSEHLSGEKPKWWRGAR